ncbi:MAG TPA: glutamate racemase [Bacteroidales bacterium]|nr:glutamate racemase [Bacteroidales bacterium]HPF03534.1 glutamate racemase [Bacteroidales bacterium]HPJ60417.1 glutamate racemase [Bacteroidales bacterium]HPR12723.1 glutamate racemase [Bacteroidales bacterium]HRW85593.1 glutamate racemase [Bacteroidales bacterium]
MKDRPIGIFDSGVGGLTVAHAIRQLLPDESIVYFGDTAHLPYGDKSADSIIQYSRKITEFLLEKDAKIILVACNSASASAYEVLKEEFPHTLILDVIDPVVDYLAKKTYSKIGVIGTKRTISSGTYDKKIGEKIKSAGVVSLATPLLVPMIEEGFIFDDISNAIIRTYLSNPCLTGIEALILGCTHYPIIKNQISKFFNFNIEVIDSAREVAQKLRELLVKNGLANTPGLLKDSFYVSDFTPWFGKISRMFFGEDIDLVRADIWH